MGSVSGPHEPHVSIESLRVPEVAPEPRRLRELPAGDPAEWSEQDAKHAELVEMRATVHTLRGHLDELQGELERALGRELAARGALARLASARPWRRRRVVAELRSHGLLR
jgi:hypothetical protein